jgi:acetoin utilization deacetylase AcuC-like enzyme/GNAT superfamily N-acetyltransferase
VISFRQIHDLDAEDHGLIRAQANHIFGAAFPYDPSGFEGVARIMGRRAERDFEPILLVSQNRRREVTGFAFFMYFSDLRIAYLQYIASDRKRPSRGIGGALYEAVCEILERKGARAMLLDVPITDIEKVRDPDRLPINKQRLAFYERFGARIISGTDWDKQPNVRNGSYLTHLLFHPLGMTTRLNRAVARKAARRILCAQYGFDADDPFVDRVVDSFKDDPLRLRAPVSAPRPEQAGALPKPRAPSRRVGPIPIAVTQGHAIHHLKERGYVERPVRVRQVLRGLEDLPTELVRSRHFADRHILAVHDAALFNYLKTYCATLGPKAIVYPNVFPVRHPDRVPEALEDRVGYYCSDTFTPLTHNAFQAARRAVDAVLTAATLVQDGARYAYALVRPPGHHAERRIFGGFCYLNNSAIAAHFLAGGGSKVALLDIDYHHGNGAQDIFYRRADVLTLSIHGHPKRSFPHFSGYEDELGEGPGLGFNRNWPLEPPVDDERYLGVLGEAIDRIRTFAPTYLVLSLGFDIMRGDPTGTFSISTRGLKLIAERLASLRLPTLIVQEGGYSVRNLRIGAAAFFAGLASSRFDA